MKRISAKQKRHDLLAAELQVVINETVKKMEEHSKDADCTVDPETDCCTVCGVMHGDPCWDCGGRGFHKAGCPAMDPEGR